MVILSVNPALLNILSALAGSAVGSMGPVISNYVMQRSVTQRELLNSQLSYREILYSDFIKEASRLYADALMHDLSELTDLVQLYALVSRIRLTASDTVVDAAETFMHRIIQQYGETNLTVPELRTGALKAKADPLGIFSFACRREIRDLFHRGDISALLHR